MNKLMPLSVHVFVMATLALVTSPVLKAQDTEPQSAPAAVLETPAALPSAPAETAQDSNDPCAHLEEQIKSLQTDRDNILAQIKISYQQKNEALKAAADAEATIKKLTEENKLLSESLNEEKSKTYTQVDKFYLERNELSEQLKQLRKESYEKMEALEAEKNRLARELEAAKGGAMASIPPAVLPPSSEEAANALELKVMQTRNEELRRQLEELKADRNTSELQIAEANSKIQALLQELEAEKEKSKNAAAVTPELIEAAQKSIAAPEELLSLRRERDRLMRENADLHYNLGVSMVQQGEYHRAVKEFMRTLELFPDDAESHFNLGRLYAEHLKNNDEAVRYFEKYMQLQPNAKDMDAVKRFVETVNAYNGEESFF